MGAYNYTTLDESQVQFFPVAEEGDLPNGERLFLEIGRLPVVIINLGGSLYAIADVCSHDDGPVGDGEIEEFEIICPRHGARFDLRTGEVLSLPAVVDIPAFPVRVRDGKIEIGLPPEALQS